MARRGPVECAVGPRGPSRGPSLLRRTGAFPASGRDSRELLSQHVTSARGDAHRGPAGVHPVWTGRCFLLLAPRDAHAFRPCHRTRQSGRSRAAPTPTNRLFCQRGIRVDGVTHRASRMTATIMTCNRIVARCRDFTRDDTLAMCERIVTECERRAARARLRRLVREQSSGLVWRPACR